MLAVVLRAYGGREVLRIEEVPDPVPAAGEVLIGVRAAGVNRADILQRMGRYPPPGPPPQLDIPGLEVAGVVEQVGEGVQGVAVGDRVMCLLPNGGYAERVVAPAEMLLPIPEEMGYDWGAAIPEAFLTAFDALVNRGRTRPGDRVLVHAAASGVGSAAVQLAHAMGARRVFGTTRTPWKARRLSELFPWLRMIVAGEELFTDVVVHESEGYGVDVVIDFIGASYLAMNLECLASRGRIVCVATLGGSRGEINIRHLMSKRALIEGTVLRARPLHEKVALTREFAHQVMPWLEEGRVFPLIHQVLPLEQVAEAHRLLEENLTLGKVVLSLETGA